MDFINFNIIDIIDIILVALLIYQVIKVVRGTGAMSIFIGIVLLYLAWILVQALNMSLLSSLLGQILGVGMIALIVLFQQEIRRFLLHIGTTYFNRSKGIRRFNKLFGTNESEINTKVIEEIVQACKKMSETNTGALIVLTHMSSLEYIIETGDRVDAIVSRRLIENIFFKNTPLHDGAMIISSNRIIAARCTLPITENTNIGPQYGMRHRAALGITEKSDADVVVVSEETGNISFVSQGTIKTMGSINELHLTIENSFKK